MVTAIEEIACPVIEASVERIKEIVKALYQDITIAADLYTIPNIHISKNPNQDDVAAYLVGQNIIVLNAVHLQTKDVERIAFILAHEVWHHRQWEDGETFSNYITPSANQSSYKSQRVEQEANDFAASLFPNVLVS